MTRALYSGLVRLHPRGFRAEFGGEMLWIFDESAGRGAAGLCADAAVSVLRQWVIGCGTWKIAAGFLGGLIHLWLVFALLMLRPPLILTQPIPADDPIVFQHQEKPLCSNCAASASSFPASQR